MKMKKYILLGLYVSSIMAAEDFFVGMTEQERKEALFAQIAYERSQNLGSENRMDGQLFRTLIDLSPVDLMEMIGMRGDDGAGLLHRTAQEGLLKSAKYLLEKNLFKVDDQSFDGQTPLHFACAKGHLDLIKLLLEYGANRDILDNHGHSPLYYACLHGQAAEMIYLLQNGAGDESNCLQELLSQGGKSAVNGMLASRFMESNKELFTACKNGDLTLIKKKVEEDKCGLSNKDKFYCTPLHVASLNGKLNIVEYLLKSGADINAQDVQKMTPLHLAAMRGHLDIVKFLVSKGADLDMTNNKNILAIDIARQKNQVEVVAYLTTAKQDVVKAREAAAIARKIEEEKAEISNKLVEACKNGNLEELKSLLVKGCDINTKNSAGESLIRIACKNSQKDIVRFLFLECADFSDLESWDPEDTYYIVEFQSIIDEMFNACKAGNLIKLEELLAEVTCINIQNTKGNSLLHIASENGHLDIVKFLIEKGARIFANKKTYYPLYLAAKFGHLEMVTYLKSLGHDMNIRDKYGRTPMHLACANGHLDVVRYLVSEGALNNVLDRDNFSPLVYACQDHKLDIVEYLVRLNPGLVSIKTTEGYIRCLSYLTIEELKSLLIKLRESNIILSEKAVGKKHASNSEILKLVNKSK